MKFIQKLSQNLEYFKFIVLFKNKFLLKFIQRPDIKVLGPEVQWTNFFYFYSWQRTKFNEKWIEIWFCHAQNSSTNKSKLHMEFWIKFISKGTSGNFQKFIGPSINLVFWVFLFYLNLRSIDWWYSRIRNMRELCGLNY